MARTKQTARKSTGGKAPRQLQSASSASQFRGFMLGRQKVDHGGAQKKKAVGRKGIGLGPGGAMRGASRQFGGGASSFGAPAPAPAPASESVTSYLNYENMFYSYTFPTGARPTVEFQPRFVAGRLRDPLTCKDEHWLGMNLNSKFDGEGMKRYGRPSVNLVVVLDISGSMGMGMGSGETKLDAAKKCLISIVDQLTKEDSLGVVLFNHDVTVQYKLQSMRKLNLTKVKASIRNVIAGGLTDLSKAANAGAEQFHGAAEAANATNRLLFLTDLNSTVDSASDEANLLKILQSEAKKAVYTSVVGIGMDLNVRLVEQISSTRGARYLSVDSGDEFQRLMEKEFAYDVTVIAFNIRVSVESKDTVWVKGHGSPEVNSIQKGKPATLSSEFPCWQDDKGESKGGIMVFKLEPKTAGGKMPASVNVKVEWEDGSGVTTSAHFTVKVNGGDGIDAGLRKAVAIIQYVDLVNDYVMDQRKHKAKFLELFQGFRPHFMAEVEKSGDTTLKSSNQGDLELLDKIISLEMPGAKLKAGTADGTDDLADGISFQGITRRVSSFVSSVKTAFSGRSPKATPVAKKSPAKAAAVLSRPTRATRSNAIPSPVSAATSKTSAAAKKKVHFSAATATTTPKNPQLKVKPIPRTTAAATAKARRKPVPVKARRAAGQRRPQAAKPKPVATRKAPSRQATRKAAAVEAVATKSARPQSYAAAVSTRTTGRRPAPPQARKQSPKVTTSRKRRASSQLQQPPAAKRSRRS